MKRNSLFSATLVIASVFLFGCTDAELEKRKADLAAGQILVQKNCLICHAQGINGAPIIGNIKMWGPRLSKGQDMLVQSATNGFGLMPAKGGNTELTDEEISLAVNYLVSQVQE